MADRLSVDVAGLSAAATSMRTVADGLDATHGDARQGESVVGSSDLADALHDFEDHWDDGRGRIKDNIEGMTKALDDSHKAYADADVQLRDALKKDQHQVVDHRGAM